jgi:oxaloacetate decarboxylase alpha subunit
MPKRQRPRLPKKAKPVKSRSARADNSSDAILGGLNLTELKRLIRLVQRTGIGELEVRSGLRTVRISAQGVAMASVPAPSVAPPGGREAASAPAPAPAAGEKLVAITSPMVGTYYRAPAPDADPYVEVGDTVEVGQTVCIIEAMKLMNEIESEIRGRVVQVLVDNAQPVEFGQKLFLVEPL